MEVETTIIYTAHGVSPETLTRWAADGPWQWLYGEKADDIVLTGWGDDDGSARCTAFRHGRLFNGSSELAWWRQGSSFTCRLMTPDVDPGDGIWVQHTDTLTPVATAQTLLHGLWDDGTTEPLTWSEARIPRHLAYPVTTITPTLDTRVILTRHRWRTQNGALVERLAGVATVETRSSQSGGEAL